MTKALKELLEKVEATTGRVPSAIVDNACAVLFGRQWTLSDWAMLNMCVNKEPTSLDAARALHEALLPGWLYVDLLRRGQRWTCLISRAVDDEPGISASNKDPARAWMICILKAKIAESEDD